MNPVCTGDNLASLERANDRGFQWFHIENDIRDAEREIHAISAELASLAPDDPGRGRLVSLRSRLRLKILSLRARQGRYRY